jgi:thioredoxin-related protein
VFEDLEEANDNDKRLLILFEQQGCGYCKKMHEKVFSVPEIAAKLQDDFLVLRINIFGDLEVTDFDGQVLPEKEIVKKWGVMFTPTMMFFPEQVSESITAAKASVVTMPGAFAKGTTSLLLDWILLKGYEGEEHLQKFIARNLNSD